MVANIGDVIVIIDKNGLNRYKSPNVKRLFGWDVDELVGKSARDKVHPDHIEGANKLLSLYFKHMQSSLDARLKIQPLPILGSPACRFGLQPGLF
ncbi:PAS domain-containing protein [Draconibacterium halophilum]|uniref:PAS domain-containing protein n=1 Tax=Draconibacterium halophilum TaxID=2706887 RepID=A0A6C0R7X1_9BACT|nr:PAS domain-containing protein [Draconibacterium halophilum]QIA06418.1 PAS domain-containing protein [Draconibacterium halophilum]